MTDTESYVPRHGTAWPQAEEFDDGAEAAIASLDEIVTGPFPDMTGSPLEEPRTTVLNNHQGAAPQAGYGAGAPAYAQAPSMTQAYAPGQAAAGYEVPPTVVRPVTQRPVSQMPAPVNAVPSQPYDDPYANPVDIRAQERAARRAERDARPSFLRRFAAFMLRLAALFPRLGAIGLCGLVIAGALPWLSNRGKVITALSIASQFVPERISGIFVTQTPFGGAFRGDLALAAFILFLVDWLMVKMASAIER